MQWSIEKAFPGEKNDASVRFLGSKDISDAHRDAFAAQRFTGELGQSAVLPGAKGATWDIAVGVGSAHNGEMVREAVGVALQAAAGVGAQTVAMDIQGLCDETMPTSAIGQAAIESAIYASYKYDTYKKAPEGRLQRLAFIVPDSRDRGRFTKGANRACVVMDGVTLARDLVNAPPHDMSPERLTDVARKIARGSKGAVKVKILDAEQCAKRGMEAYLAVGKGSQFAPQFIHLTYAATATRRSRKTLAVVGKGVTFDSGGLSLKPADAMTTMKCDMAGAAAVLGLFATLAVLRPNVRVEGIIPACENMPSGAAMRPGDIVRASNGKTIEILNTDAEGRLTLADALDYAVKLKPDVIVDLATLTGACVVGLGEEISGLMSNDEDLAVDVLAAAERAGEKMWEMPLEKRYRSLIESDVADLRNTATSRYGGSLTAGLFLREFVDNVPWAHIDIAGPAYAERPMSSYIGKGGTGHAVRTLVELVQAWS